MEPAPAPAEEPGRNLPVVRLGDVERIGEWGPALLTEQYMCLDCRSPFEWIRAGNPPARTTACSSSRSTAPTAATRSTARWPTALRAVLRGGGDDAAVRAVILTGEGSAFSRRRRPSRFERDWDPREFRHDSHRLTSLISLVERLEKPTVAAINGVATGAGTQLALACDVRLTARARFVYREGRLGIIPSHGGVTRLVKLIGLARARDVILSAGRWSPRRRRARAGHRGRRGRRLLDAARERLVADAERSPQAYAAAKRLLWLAATVDLESGMVAEGLAQSLLIGPTSTRRRSRRRDGDR